MHFIFLLQGYRTQETCAGNFFSVTNTTGRRKKGEAREEIGLTASYIYNCDVLLSVISGISHYLHVRNLNQIVCHNGQNI